jgi:hypothetical protein
MDALTLIMLGWIVANTGMSLPEPPDIKLVPQEELVEIQYGPSPPETTFQLEALYNHHSGTVYLRESWDAEDLFDRSVLLHELVHHVQITNELEVPCLAALERQAYELQAQWLEEQGIEDPYGLMGTNEFTVRLLTACGPAR